MMVIFLRSYVICQQTNTRSVVLPKYSPECD